MPSAEQIRALSTRAHPNRASSSLPRRPRQVEGVGAVGTGGSLVDPGAAEGLPYPGKRSAGIRTGAEEPPPAEGTPAARPPRGPRLRQRCPSWAEERPGPYACPGSLDLTLGVVGAPRRRWEGGGGGGGWRSGGPGAQAAGLPGRKAVCGHVVRYVRRARGC